MGRSAQEGITVSYEDDDESYEDDDETEGCPYCHARYTHAPECPETAKAERRVAALMASLQGLNNLSSQPALSAKDWTKAAEACGLIEVVDEDRGDIHRYLVGSKLRGFVSEFGPVPTQSPGSGVDP